MKRNGTESGASEHQFSPKQQVPLAFIKFHRLPEAFNLSHHYFLSIADSVAVKKTYLVPRWRVINDKLEPVTQHDSERYM